MTQCPKLATALSQIIVVANQTCEQRTLYDNSSKVSVGDIVTFTCNQACKPSYTVTTTECTSNGIWNPAPPFCTAPPADTVITDTLSREDIVIIAATVGSVAALIFIIVFILLLCQKFYRPDHVNDERQRIISQFGASPDSSFHSKEYQPRARHLYENEAVTRDHPPIGLSRSRSLPRESRDFEHAHRSGRYQTNIRRSDSLQEGHRWESEGIPPDDTINMNVFNNGIKKYYVPRPEVGDRFEPLWTGSNHM